MGPAMIVTTNDLPGHRSTAGHGVARGLTVRSRSALGNIGGSIPARFGGNLLVYTNLAETARHQACDLLTRHAESMEANAIVAMRHDANDIMDGITEVLAFGTAVTLRVQVQVQVQTGQAR